MSMWERIENAVWVAMMTSIVAPLLFVWITFCLKISAVIWQAGWGILCN